MNIFSVTAVFVVFSAAILATGLEDRLSSAVMRALYWSFGATLLIGLGEVVSGVRLTKYFYPNSSSLAIDNRLLVAAYFPNYNDFAVVVTMFGLMALVRFLMTPGTVAVQVARMAGFTASSVLIVGQGSRGALIALLLGSVIVVIQSIRLTRPFLITPLSVVLTALGTVLAGALLWVSPFIQDHSTAVRGSILGNTLQLAPDTSSQFWFGWGDNSIFREAAFQAFPWQLMDPHNVLLEAFVWYGLPTLIALIALWSYVTWRGVWRLEIRSGWEPMAAVLLFGMMPILGMVPSSSLRYYYIFLLAPCGVAALSHRRRT
ncbi:O-antigen ligase family protein [Tessaracoccus sp.]